jgi:16S rRNA (uracil1498-N3)-methyltransferase
MALPRFHVPLPLVEGQSLSLPPAAARHVQVLRLQPGLPVLLFNGTGGEHEALVESMGRSEVTVVVGRHVAVDRELPVSVTLAMGMPANERMDGIVEKCTELGVAGLQPLVCERSVLRLSGERADKRRAHWQGIASAAAEQSGRTRVPVVGPVLPLATWLRELPSAPLQQRWLLSPGAAPSPLVLPSGGSAVVALSGPEGGLSADEEAAAVAAGFVRVSLGSRVLRADTAPMALMSWVSLSLACCATA